MIPGLIYIADFISEEEQALILAKIDSEPWCGDLKRRTQHYGYKYDYTYKKIDESMKVGPVPEFALELCKRYDDNFVPDQMIVNEYLPGQGIAPHIDCEPCFKDTIISISLNSVYKMQFYDVLSDKVLEIKLGLGSLLMLSDEARYKWRHGIKGNAKYGRRVSLTFRNVIL